MRDEDAALEQRQTQLERFYQGMLPALVDFVDCLGIRPAHEVLKHAQQFVPHLETALSDLVPANEDDRTWLFTRVAYFVGEFFVQRHQGCWYVNDVKGSRFFARYVVGHFPSAQVKGTMVDPFEVAQAFVDTACPRKLSYFLAEVDAAVTCSTELH